MSCPDVTVRFVFPPSLGELPTGSVTVGSRVKKIEEGIANFQDVPSKADVPYKIVMDTPWLVTGIEVGNVKNASGTYPEVGSIITVFEGVLYIEWTAAPGSDFCWPEEAPYLVKIVGQIEEAPPEDGEQDENGTPPPEFEVITGPLNVWAFPIINSGKDFGFGLITRIRERLVTLKKEP